MAEWLALPTFNCGDPSSIPAKVKTFFGGIVSFEQYIGCRFNFNFNFNSIKFFKTKFQQFSDLPRSRQRVLDSRRNWRHNDTGPIDINALHCDDELFHVSI